jgi:hypothetical protein
MYGGVEWRVKISSLPNPVADKHSLRADGHMPIVGRDWRQFYVLQRAGAALRGEITP